MRIGARPRTHNRPWGANASELALAELIEKRGKSEIVRTGWPDFLLRRKSDNRLFGVEVKATGDSLRPAQIACFTALEAGGLPVYVWNPRYPDTFMRWRDYQAVPHDRLWRYSPLAPKRLAKARKKMRATMTRKSRQRTRL